MSKRYGATPLSNVDSNCSIPVEKRARFFLPNGKQSAWQAHLGLKNYEDLQRYKVIEHRSLL